MSPTQKKRFTVIALVVFGMSIATFLALQAMQSSIEYFRTPTQVANDGVSTEQTYRVAGLVRKGSVTRLEDGVTQRFRITDCENDVAVQYTGILPDLFREGQAIVTVGKFDAKPMLIASQVLAKHDENYVPNEAADAVMLAQANKCDEADGPVSY
ncbi:cytochrome c maturation protein CcmE [Arenicella sp. 4NH20-0111]|uniref:cytochrome c maturation protein CcmE n=1 Tax=Arenicella sp. 4NH20-0111 TaxID=3127648 RepID=UPI00310AC13D